MIVILLLDLSYFVIRSLFVTCDIFLVSDMFHVRDMFVTFEREREELIAD